VNWVKFVHCALNRTLKVYDEPALRALWAQLDPLTSDETLSYLEQARTQNGLHTNPCLSIAELRGFTTCSGILPGPPAFLPPRDMRLVVFADSTCNVYPGKNPLKQGLWDRNWTKYDQKGGSGYTLSGLNVELQKFISAEHKATKTTVLDETLCVVFVWNGNDFLTPRYRDHLGDIQQAEVDRYLRS